MRFESEIFLKLTREGNEKTHTLKKKHRQDCLPKIRAKDATYSSSCVEIAKFGCREVWN